MVMVLKLEGEQVVEAQFQTYGCPSAIACGQYLTEWLPGKSLTEASRMGAGEVAAAVGGLPLGKEFTASLAVDSLRNAIQEAGAPNGGEPVP